MIGVYDYTVILTYLSLMSAGAGIVISLSGTGHPYLGVFFLLFCGLLDAFDGKVARHKKDRTTLEVNYGIQIDSLSDLVAFGVLPSCIGVAIIKVSPFFDGLSKSENPLLNTLPFIVCYVILALFALTALIRLAYFNVTEEERQRTEGGVRKFYTGLPVTSAALIFPSVLLLDYILPLDISFVYIPVALLTSVLFVSKLQIPKLGLRGILVMVGIGLVECVLLVLELLEKFAII